MCVYICVLVLARVLQHLRGQVLGQVLSQKRILIAFFQDLQDLRCHVVDLQVLEDEGPVDCVVCADHKIAEDDVEGARLEGGAVHVLVREDKEVLLPACLPVIPTQGQAAVHLLLCAMCAM